MPRAFTRARQAASTSPCGRRGKFSSAQRASRSAKRRCAASKNGHASVEPSISLTLEHRLLPGGEGAKGAGKIFGLHAERLRDRLGLDRGLDRHRPFYIEHALGHGIAEGRTVRQL